MTLMEKTRKKLEDKHGQLLTCRETADALGVSVTSLRSYTFRADTSCLVIIKPERGLRYAYYRRSDVVKFILNTPDGHYLGDLHRVKKAFKMSAHVIARGASCTHCPVRNCEILKTKSLNSMEQCAQAISEHLLLSVCNLPDEYDVVETSMYDTIRARCNQTLSSIRESDLIK